MMPPILPGLFLLLALTTLLPAEPARAVSAARLVLRGQPEVAFLSTGGRVASTPFTGVAFYQGEGWRAEVTFSNGVRHGPVSVVVRGRLFSQFEYQNGKKILK
jgi:hypothetical protein